MVYSGPDILPSLFVTSGPLLLERRGEAMARGLPAVLHVQTVAGGRDQLLLAGREYLLQNGLLSVSGGKITRSERGSCKQKLSVSCVDRKWRCHPFWNRVN